jgi:hypothetical protein
MTWHQHDTNSSGNACSVLITGSAQPLRANLCFEIDHTLGSPNNHNTIPKEYSLSQNYPNPFNPSTKISFSVPKSGNVKLTVYDLLGREIRTLIQEFKHPGNYSVDFDGSEFASGIYFYRIEAADFIAVKKMVLLK